MVIENPQIERVTGYLTRLQLVATRDRLEAVLQQAAKGESTYLDCRAVGGFKPPASSRELPASGLVASVG